MKFIITNPAKARFREMYEFYKKEGKGMTARKIRATIQKKALILKESPYIGQVETQLEHLGEGHRYPVAGNYKIIYKVTGQFIFVTDIFDTRQDPGKIKP